MLTTTLTEFWSFSLAHYAKPTVAELCLTLQDIHGIDVNLLLWTLWLESRNQHLTPERLQQAIAAAQSWQENYVTPLRELRRTLKRDFAENLQQVSELRDQIKHAELLAEKQEQQWLDALAQKWPTEDIVVKGDNTLVYLTYLGLPRAAIEQALPTLRI